MSENLAHWHTPILAIGILKLNIIGPGVNILVAWPLSVENITGVTFKFNVVYGTLMSCPCLSGVVVLLQGIHLNWSPVVIKSTIMTSVDIVSLDNAPIEDEKFVSTDIFVVGYAHVNPSKANDLGLIYDIELQDYIPYLCGMQYTHRQKSMNLQHKVNCSDESSILEGELNYPSFSIVIELSS
ncbi:subtilisin-like protease [Olea europaea subsp. europaea]|uniref:Subtilisin-like protease n=1 Tax=Olea europaea subsp. europaea TaxID=158383 RepID=A0A8S0VCM5_OLEEU|nr:subtilisin-like protease [Olea europaea subsp. europaea]